jgi:SAM-dependent methyltransferase
LQIVKFDKYVETGAYHWIQCDRNARSYNPPLEARYKVVIDKLGETKRALDVGCGDGYLMNLLRLRCEEAVGIEFDEAGIELAAAKLAEYPNCNVIRASCYEMPFAGQSFDAVLLADVIEHLPEPDKCLKEIGRVLTPDGALFLTTPKWRADRMWDKHHVKEYTPEDLRNLLLLYFSDVRLSFFWPMRWSKLYSTKVGWRLIRLFARYAYNPFLREGLEAEHYGQILALCRNPRKLIEK